MKIFQNFLKKKNSETIEQEDPEPRLSMAEIERIVEQSVNEKIERLWNN